ncbi:hypothetical protein BESB_078460 [Besnoitia besnoiti]|uniref:Transmembrane protein n=1 Tax=Besnoitia besnoiti TaxID=94643 RepID=A0A2A9ME20_BESBE|nr:hypothetical protein BESB_078460 [Besnoitia besnoiti]PFH33630.1 hypothetical protein BESB_078460 [Besnoitia besnoiti]
MYLMPVRPKAPVTDREPTCSLVCRHETVRLTGKLFHALLVFLLVSHVSSPIPAVATVSHPGYHLQHGPRLGRPQIYDAALGLDELQARPIDASRDRMSSLPPHFLHSHSPTYPAEILRRSEYPLSPPFVRAPAPKTVRARLPGKAEFASLTTGQRAQRRTTFGTRNSGSSGAREELVQRGVSETPLERTPRGDGERGGSRLTGLEDSAHTTLQPLSGMSYTELGSMSTTERHDATTDYSDAPLKQQASHGATATTDYAATSLFKGHTPSELLSLLHASAQTQLTQFFSTSVAPFTRAIADTCLSTTAVIAFIVLIVYLYFMVRVFTLCRALAPRSTPDTRKCSPPSLSCHHNPKASEATKKETLLSVDGTFEPEWFLRGWHGAALTALSGFGEPWEHVIAKATTARKGKQTLQAAEHLPLGELSDFPTPAASGKEKRATGIRGVDTHTPGHVNLFRGRDSIHSTRGNDFCCEANTAARHSHRLRLLPIHSGAAEARESFPCGSLPQQQELPCSYTTHYPAKPLNTPAVDPCEEEPAFQLAAAYMQDRAFRWWAAYFAASSGFIFLVFLAALESEQHLLSSAFQSLCGIPLQLPPWWGVIAAVQWLTATCLLYGILSDYAYATNGAFQSRHKVRLHLAVGVLSLIFLSLIFARGSSYPADCLVWQGSAPPLATVAGAPASEGPSPSRQSPGGPHLRPISPNRKDVAPPLFGSHLASEAGTVLDPYTHGRATQQPSARGHYPRGGEPAGCASSARFSAYWLGLSVACYLFLRLLCLGLVLSLASNEDTFLQKRDSEATVSFSWMVAGVSFALVDLFPFPLLALLSGGPLAHWFPLRGVDILLCTQCLYSWFFFRHVQRELFYATHSSVTRAIRKIQETFQLRTFN